MEHLGKEEITDVNVSPSRILNTCFSALPACLLKAGLYSEMWLYEWRPGFVFLPAKLNFQFGTKGWLLAYILSYRRGGSETPTSGVRHAQRGEFILPLSFSCHPNAWLGFMFLQRGCWASSCPCALRKSSSASSRDQPKAAVRSRRSLAFLYPKFCQPLLHLSVVHFSDVSDEAICGAPGAPAARCGAAAR